MEVSVAYKAGMITPAQIRAARSLIGWTQVDLAKRSGVSAMSIKNIEREANNPSYKSLAAIERAFDEGGVIFLDPYVNREGSYGVRLK